MLETLNLLLLPFAPRHLLALIEEPAHFEDLVGYPAANGLRGFFVSGEVSPRFIARLRSADGPDPWIYGYAVVHREHHCVIGTAGFKGAPDETGMVEIAYGIVPDYEGRGYATEASSALVDFAFREERVHLVRAHTLPTGNASTRVLTKCGFSYVGEVDDPEDGRVWRWERGES